MSTKLPTYDLIGKGYNSRRAADVRILSKLVALLDQPEGAHILDVGAGTGNYTAALADLGYSMTALEPSTIMLESAVGRDSIDWYRGSAEAMPFDDDQFDAVYCTLSMHHFTDPELGLNQIRRVLKPGGRFVAFTSDPRRIPSDFWMRAYFDALFVEAEAIFPPMGQLLQRLAVVGFAGAVDEAYPVPSDNQDGFFCSAWRRPEEYLDEAFRAGISSFRLMDPQQLDSAVACLRSDLESGRWHGRHAAILEPNEFDCGHSFVVASKPPE